RPGHGMPCHRLYPHRAKAGPRAGAGPGGRPLLAYDPDCLLNVALEADADRVRPWPLTTTLVIRRLEGTPLGRVNEKELKELGSSEPSPPPELSTLMLMVCGPV